MKITALILTVLVILSTSFPAPIKAADNDNSGNNVGAICDPKQLQPCLAAITGGGQPSVPCCAKLKEQQPCLCGFAKIPAFAQYITSPNSRKLLTACGVPFPTC